MRMFPQIALVCTLALAAGTARAGPWIEATGAYGTYAMGDVNDDIRRLNAMIRQEPGDPAGMDEIEGGFSFAVAIGFDLPRGWTVGGGYERFTASTSTGTAGYSFEYNLPADAFKALLAYRLSAGGWFEPALGVGVGLVTLAGEVSPGLVTASPDLEGTGLLLEAFGQGRFLLARGLSLVPALGYRHAEVSEVELEGEPMSNPDGSSFSVDYSGIFARLGLRLGF